MQTNKPASPAHKPAPTPFQTRVYAALKTVPRGRVTTYGLLARLLGCGSAQAVGQALRQNPFAPIVPCHRVIAADLTLGGFCGQRTGAALRRKIRLLAAEGVTFTTAGCLAEPTRVFRFAAPRAATQPHGGSTEKGAGGKPPTP